MSYRRTKAVSFNELDRMERDVRSAVTALGVPVAMLRSSGFALSLDAGKIPMMVYDRDATEANCGKHFSWVLPYCGRRPGRLWRDGVGAERGETRRSD